MYDSDTHQLTRTYYYVPARQDIRTGTSRSAATFTGGISNIVQRAGVPVTFKLLSTNVRLSCVPRPFRVDLLFQCTKWYNIVVSSTPVASRGVTGHSVGKK